MTNNRDPYTTASAAPENAANYLVELVAVEDISQKIYHQGRAGRLTAHMQAIRLVSSAQ